jgi:hypothetical protein
MQRRHFKQLATAGRKAWRAPRVARLDAGSAETGPATEEDGEFTAS